MAEPSSQQQSAPPAQDQPQQPEQQEEEQPGPRAARLQEIYARSLKKTLSKLDWDNFAGCYPTIAKRAEPVLKQVQEKMVDNLSQKCDSKFNSIIKTRNVIPKLNNLESLVSDASQRRKDAPPDAQEPRPPHTYPPSAILAAHLLPSLAAHQSQLNAQLQNTQVQNALLVDDVRRQRAEIEELLTQLEDVVDDVRGANAALEGVVGDLAQETRMDADML
ncbi:hypothetical protein K4F52_003015 [Lecanicillium sp. MT-2017a]|nr:hypothetical protein K4F52_003015 [Lecanicillium sp. MT-2017a]